MTTSTDAPSPQGIPSTQLTNIDWLAFSILLSETEEESKSEPRLLPPAGFSIMEFTGTNMYKHRAIVYDPQGEKVLTLLWRPHSKIIAQNSMLVEVANPLLYSGEFRRVRDLLQAIHPHTWQSLSRLDLATDFQPSVAQWQIISMLATGSAYVQGKQDGNMWHNYNSAGQYVTRTPRQLAWGAAKSQVKWKLYNKTKEIHETTTDGRTWCTKPYIKECWQKAGFKPDTDTWRLEVSIMGSGQLQWHGHRLTWDTVADRDTYTSLYYDLYSTRMKMRLNQGHTNKRYDKELEFLATPEQDVSRISKAAPASEQTHVSYAPTIRSLVREIERPEVMTNPAVHRPLLSTLEHIVTHSGLRGYFAAMVGRDLFTYIDDYLEKNSGRP